MRWRWQFGQAPPSRSNYLDYPHLEELYNVLFVLCIICIMYFYIRAILYNVLFFKDYDINLNDVLVPHKPE